MEILNQVENLDRELEKVILGEGNTHAVNGLENLHQKIESPINDFKLAINFRKLLCDLPRGYEIKSFNEEEVEFLQQTLRVANLFLEKWDELDQKYQISQDNICSDVRDLFGSFNKELNIRSWGAYNAWLNQLKDEVCLSESDLENQENTPNLKDNAFEFRRLYSRFCTQVDLPIPTGETISNLISIREKLIEIKGKMEFDQPDDVVKLFKYLKRIGNNGRAPLSMLTPEVRQWMADKSEESYFYISDKRISNR